MRNEQEMADLILRYAEADDNIRAVILNGSRANPNAPRDKYQDYDIIYVVRDMAPMINDESWIDHFGRRLMLQRPEAMRDPSGETRFAWLMLFEDYNRIDLSIIPQSHPELYLAESQTIILLDKDGVLPAIQASDRDFWVKAPDTLYYFSCCNNFWWCMQNVAKGLARGETPYAMDMYNGVIREELDLMLSWYVAMLHGFEVSIGKGGKYFGRYLPKAIYKEYLATYACASHADIWRAADAACTLFEHISADVAGHFGFDFNHDDPANMRKYLDFCREE